MPKLPPRPAPPPPEPEHVRVARSWADRDGKDFVRFSVNGDGEGFGGYLYGKVRRAIEHGQHPDGVRVAYAAIVAVYRPHQREQYERAIATAVQSGIDAGYGCPCGLPCGLGPLDEERHGRMVRALQSTTTTRDFE